MLEVYKSFVFDISKFLGLIYATNFDRKETKGKFKSLLIEVDHRLNSKYIDQ